MRISPACAGNTFLSIQPIQHKADQPRVRGEHFGIDASAITSVGSAPRARGTLVVVFVSIFAISDQPRVRGEHSHPNVGYQVRYGSAPRARGTLGGVRGGGLRGRISPACAGNTPAGSAKTERSPDQPRVRGEHSSRTILLLNSFFDVKERTGLLWGGGLFALGYRVPWCAARIVLQGRVELHEF